jgi:hypothetical protein
LDGTASDKPALQTLSTLVLHRKSPVHQENTVWACKNLVRPLSYNKRCSSRTSRWIQVFLLHLSGCVSHQTFTHEIEREHASRSRWASGCQGFPAPAHSPPALIQTFTRAASESIPLPTHALANLHPLTAPWSAATTRTGWQMDRQELRPPIGCPPVAVIGGLLAEGQ